MRISFDIPRQRQLAFGLMCMALLALWWTMGGPSYLVPLTDFGRDLIGADAARAGVSPYQTVGDLLVYLPEWDLVPEAYDHWVAHSPFAVVFARLWSALFRSAPESAFRMATWFAFGFVATWLGLNAGRRWGHIAGVALAAAVGMSYGISSEIWYLSGASLTAFGLVIVFELEKSTARTWALVLLGVFVAWRPWLAPLALFLPARRSLGRDLLAVGSVAGAVTLVSVAGIGGLPVLRDWLLVALPANLEQVQWWSINMSVVGSAFGPHMTSLLFVLISLTAASLARFVDHRRWWLLGVLTILVASPLVWPQYWVSLLPLVVLGSAMVSFPWLLLVLLLMSSWVAGINPALSQFLMVIVVGLGVLELTRTTNLAETDALSAGRLAA